jgi:hypothetical protein
MRRKGLCEKKAGEKLPRLKIDLLNICIQGAPAVILRLGFRHKETSYRVEFSMKIT